MKNKEFGEQMEARTMGFAINVIKLSVLLPNTIEIRVIKNQLTKSGTSIGANYREANRSRSNAEFKHKIKICESETNETIYWLDLIGLLKAYDYGKVELLLTEAKEFLAIFTSIHNKLKTR